MYSYKCGQCGCMYKCNNKRNLKTIITAQSFADVLIASKLKTIVNSFNADKSTYTGIITLKKCRFNNILNGLCKSKNLIFKNS